MLELGLSISSPSSVNNEVQWWLDGASMALDFTSNRAMLNGGSVDVIDLISCNRATTGVAKNIAGNDIVFGINELRITDKGLYIYQADGGVAADDVKFTDIGWFNPSLGSFFIEWEQITSGAGTQNLVRWKGSTWSRIRSGSAAIMQLQDITPALIFNAGMFSAPSLGIHKVASAIAPNDMAFARSVSLDGNLSTDSSGVPFSPVSAITLGGNNIGGEMLNGWLRSLTYFPVRKSDADLQGMLV